MMRYILAIAMLLFGLSGCWGGASAPTPTPLAGSASGIHLLVQAEGPVTVKRPGWETFAPARFGTTLRIGDLLRLDAAQATVVCADLTIVSVQRGVNSIPCPIGPQPALVYDDSQINQTRGSETPSFPQMITPRQTKLLGDRPLIRWTAVRGAAGYTVELIRASDAQRLWKVDAVPTNALAYPQGEPALEYDTLYRVRITGGGHSSDEEQVEALGFAMLNPDEAAAIRGDEATIGKLKLPQGSTQLLIANLYASNGLIAEAIGLLENLRTQMPEPAVMRALGGLYAQLGVGELAAARYREALQMSGQTEDIEGQALAQRALGELALAGKNGPAAIQHLSQASMLYERLGDSRTRDTLRKNVSALQQVSTQP